VSGDLEGTRAFVSRGPEFRELRNSADSGEPTVVAVLCAFVRDNAREPRVKLSVVGFPTTGIQAALDVVASRNIANDGSHTVDLNGTNSPARNCPVRTSHALASEARTSAMRTSRMRTSPTRI
jgi:hypothetical protein